MLWSLDGKLTDGEPSGWRLTGGIWFPDCKLLGGRPVQRTGTAGAPLASLAAAFGPPMTKPYRLMCGAVQRSSLSDCSARAQAIPPPHRPELPLYQNAMAGQYGGQAGAGNTARAGVGL